MLDQLIKAFVHAGLRKRQANHLAGGYGEEQPFYLNEIIEILKKVLDKN